MHGALDPWEDGARSSELLQSIRRISEAASFAEALDRLREEADRRLPSSRWVLEVEGREDPEAARLLPGLRTGFAAEDPSVHRVPLGSGPRPGAWLWVRGQPADHAHAELLALAAAAVHGRVEADAARVELARARERQEGLQRLILIAAHELGGVLTPMGLQVDVWRKRNVGLDASQARGLDLLVRNLGRLRGLVGDLFLLGAEASGRFELHRQPCDLGEVVHEATETFMEAARSAQVELRAPPRAPMPLEGDARWLTHVLCNLLGNALRHTPPGGRVCVTLAQDPEGVEVRVSDTGCGIQAADLPRLFHPFVRLESERGTGMGLGLYISRRVIEGHGGELWCESPGDEGGATFAFRLPSRPAAVGSGGNVRVW